MPLNKDALITSLKSIFDGVSPDSNNITDPKVLRDRVATQMADAIEVFVKSGKVTVDSGITVSTTGTASAQTGKTTSTGTGTIS